MRLVVENAPVEEAARILVVEDDSDIAETLRVILGNENFVVEVASDGASALEILDGFSPNLILLDLMLPDMPGLEVLKGVKRQPRHAEARVIILTAKNDEIDRIVGLELGSDDYVAKPFSPRELVLRVRRLLGRPTNSKKSEPRQINAGPITIDLDFHQVRVAGRALDLTLTEFRLLVELVQAKGRVRSRANLLSEIWGYDSEVMSRTVDTHIRRLRHKLGPASDWLATVRGVGYQIRDPKTR